MHTGTLKKLALALTFWLAVHMSSLKAQILLGPYSNSTASFEVNANGLLTDTGSGGTLSLSGAGTRMFWYPGKAAFRAGSVNGTQWDDDNIGQYSVAMGLNTTASGYASLASGIASSASGKYSIAMGNSCSAYEYGSVAMGNSCSAQGYGSIAMGYFCSADSPWLSSVALGCFSSASGMGSFAVGGGTATGYYSVALGGTANGYSSTASGYSTATGDNSTSSGYNTQATSFADFVIGAYNVGLPEPGSGSTSVNPSDWVSTDPLFEIGNGGSEGAYYWSEDPNDVGPSDALVVYKNGDTAIQGNLSTGGVITAAAGGDIPMYTGGN